MDGRSRLTVAKRQVYKEKTPVTENNALKTRTYLKIRIFGRDQGGAEYQPAGILKYVEDLRGGLNADIGRKDFFEIGSNLEEE